MKIKNIIYNLDNIEKVVDQILLNSNTGLLCFYGGLGAGKTTLIKEILKELRATEPGNSPTFGLVNEYLDADGNLLAYHLDCYRIGDPEEALDFGIEEYLYADCWVFVEWPEKIEVLLPEERTNIHLEQLDGNSRRLTIYP